MYGKNVNLKNKCHCKKICAAARCLCKITGTQCKVECRCKGNCTIPPTSVLEEGVDDPDPVLDKNGFPST
ncbi:Cysteine/serine-rich nuclear protein 1 [Frankliniella fusca]|uniref:Cysteine/serine-rich nuclear protein 1 n=1 Tax=Frankliniella fusca TaxID=407009 RepID=A0AAE1HJ57_9NEOP|nr:Cysteine/serine-rich nuclear protein 1 [Frankliniella fusca]